jgi:PKD repeat protein
VQDIIFQEKLFDRQQNISHSRPVRLATVVLPVLIVGIVAGSLAGLQWAGWRGITLGYPQPQVQIAAPSTATLISNQSYQFSATASGRDLSYSWDFGDQGTASGANVTHTYASNGPFTVEVFVTDPAGHQATQSTTVTVVPPKPQAFFTYSVDQFDTTYASFDASNSSADPSTSIASYNWDFGDGSAPDSTTFPQDSHFYSNPGTYQVTLTVIDATGQPSDPYTATVTISSGSMVAN